MRRQVDLDAGGLAAAVLAPLGDLDDEVADRVLDAAAELFAELGIRRVTMEDVAERSGLGRTTLYRRFGGRDQLVAEVLGREVRRFATSVLARTASCTDLEEAIVEGFVHAVGAPEVARLAELARREPDVLRLLTLDSGPLVAAAATALAAAAEVREPGIDRTAVLALAEAGVRVAISLVLAPSALIDHDRPGGSREVLHRLVDPAVAQLRSG